jgi:hypothetical protein
LSPVTVAVSIDTEEDNWGSFAVEGATNENIGHLLDLQEVFDRWGARATYLVNRSPLMERKSVDVLGRLSARDDVEIGAHCHPWNTPPYTGEGPGQSMMCNLTDDQNRLKVREVADRLHRELGVAPQTFRAGRWGLGPGVARALVAEGIRIDCSVSPFVDWSPVGGPDYSQAPYVPYRFHPARPLEPDPTGELIQLPTTVGFLGGGHRLAGTVRHRLERSWLARLKIIGALDTAGFLALRWLSPETSSGQDMVRLADSMIRSGSTFLQLTFHSCTLLPGATPFVRTEGDRTRLLRDIDELLAHCHGLGCTFRTLREVPAAIGIDRTAEQ